MPSGDHCCVPKCKSDRRNVEDGQILLFHCFPGSPMTKTGQPRDVSEKEKDTKAKWKHAIRRVEKLGEFSIVPYETVVCSDHFVDEDYCRGKKAAGARLKTDAVPTVFEWSATSAPKRALPERQAEPPQRQPREPQSDKARYAAEKKRSEDLEKQLAEVKAELYDVEVECCLKMFSLARFEDSDSDIQYYTGFPTMKAFDACLDYVELSEENVVSSRSKPTDDETRKRARGGGRKSKLSIREKFFLTLVRLRRGTDFRMLGDLYFTSSVLHRHCHCEPHRADHGKLPVFASGNDPHIPFPRASGLEPP